MAIAGTNIVFPSGTIDPWHALGVTNYTQPLPQPSEVKVYIEGTAHCNDLKAPASSDPPSLTYARQVIAANVNSWLNPTPTPMSTDDSTSSDSLSTGAIVGIVIGGTAFVILIAVLVWYFTCGKEKTAGTGAYTSDVMNPVSKA